MKAGSFKIKQCPTCGSPAIHKVWRAWKGSVGGRAYIVPDLEFYECPRCQEKVYPPQAMRQIEAYSPAYARRRLKGGETAGARAGKSVARSTKTKPHVRPRKPGSGKGKFWMSDDFDAPLPKKLLDLFYK